jgi:3-methylcrotonyl-CoA carboxylase alpha subunit
MKTGTFTVRHGNDEHRVSVSSAGDVQVGETAPLAIVSDGPNTFRVREGEGWRRVFVAASGSLRQVFVDGEVYEFTVDEGAAPRARAGRQALDTVAAPMPAKVTAIVVEPGQIVGKGEVLLKLEAMKMELPVRAPHEGTVKAVLCKVGDLVQPGVALVELA